MAVPEPPMADNVIVPYVPAQKLLWLTPSLVGATGRFPHSWLTVSVFVPIFTYPVLAGPVFACTEIVTFSPFLVYEIQL